MTTLEAAMVKRIRRMCGQELGVRPETRFFHMSYEPGLSDDEAILKLFRDESEAQTVWRDGVRQRPSFEQVVGTLCHG